MLTHRFALALALRHVLHLLVPCVCHPYRLLGALLGVRADGESAVILAARFTLEHDLPQTSAISRLNPHPHLRLLQMRDNVEEYVPDL